jgi:polysaccharide export outer membrane protein
VQVFNHPEFSGRSRVREDGNVSIPLVGDLQAAGQTGAELARAVEQQLGVRSLVVAARATVALEERAPLRVSLLGEVARPGLFALDPGAGVAEALASAGGLTEFAHRDRIYIVRRTPTPMRIRLRYRDLSGESAKAAMFRLRPNDVIVVE